LNFDWGSQSIAQSKFQRASPKGKEIQQELLRLLRQHLIENIRKMPPEELLLAVLDSSHRPACAGSPRIEGEGGTCEVAGPLQDLSLTQTPPFINRLNDNGLQFFFWAENGADFRVKIRRLRPPRTRGGNWYSID
jgi:hypothetical protein